MLGDPMPNPFRCDVSLPLYLAAPGTVEAGVYDMSGRLVETVFRGAMRAGEHTLRWRGGGAPSGLYVCRVTVGDGSVSSRIVLTR